MGDDNEKTERREKTPKVIDAEITEDGYLVVEFNQKLVPEFTSKKAVLDATMLLSIVKEYGEIPPKEATDFPGLPHVAWEDVFGDDADEDEAADGEDEEEEAGEDHAATQEE